MGAKINKTGRIRYAALRQKGVFTKMDLAALMPDISHMMIQHELSQMVSDGLLIRSGNTKGTQYETKKMQ